MGIQNQGSRNLVVMTNKDVHFISLVEVRELAQKIKDKEALHLVTDTQSGSDVYIQVPNISTIVVEAQKNG
jgi:hypothetical protein